MSPREMPNLAGMRFWDWMVLNKAPQTGHAADIWLCQCKCGRQKIKTGTELRSGKSKGCISCPNPNRGRTHGMSRTPLYRSWMNMRRRCYDPNNTYYRNYGGRGIRVCDEWHNRKGFPRFCEWAKSNGYKEGLTIDRIDNNGTYCPENCKWSTRKEQSHNTRNTVKIVIFGKLRPLVEWAEDYHVHAKTLYTRYKAGEKGGRLLRPSLASNQYVSRPGGWHR